MKKANSVSRKRNKNVSPPGNEKAKHGQFSLLDRVVEEFCRGQMRSLVKKRFAIDKLVEVGRLRESHEILARLMAAKLYLMMFEPMKALHLLNPFARMDSERRVQIQEDHITRVQKKYGNFWAGLIRSHIGNILYRLREFDQGEEQARKAKTLLDDEGPFDRLFRLLNRTENHVWRARLAWRCKRRAEAEQLLADVVNELTRSYDVYRKGERGGIDLALAFALNIWAAFDWTQGNLHSAQKKIYQSLFLLRSGEVDDPVRLAHSLYMAGKIEAAHITTDIAWALRLIEEAENLFRSCRHPFERRCVVQKAQFLVRANRKIEALNVLDSPRIENVPIENDERTYAEAELNLARVWIHEAEAREQMRSWESCLTEAQKLMTAIDNVPLRLQIEAHLHYGLALAHLGKGSEGQEHILKAINGAEADGRTRIKIGGYFALVESLLSSKGNTASVSRYWQQAIQMSTDVPSSSLWQWREFLAPRVAAATNAPMLIEIGPSQSFPDAEMEFKRAFLEYHKAKGHTPDDVGISRATLFRWTKELRLNKMKKLNQGGQDVDLDAGSPRGETLHGLRGPAR